MIARSLTVLAWALSFFRYGAAAAAAPTWPSSMDELEDIMVLNTGYQARGFAQPITPCSSAGAEGFITAAQWVRMAFHDMGTANVATGVGGLDASIVFELGYGSNNSPGFSVTLLQLSPFLSSRSSMSDLIALSVYTAVRGCGGPVVPVRTGRIDATAQGPSPDVFLPQPQNSLLTFQAQFQRFGFSNNQMIAVVACGHTLGQVHSITFPQIATAGPKNLDSTPTVFDQHVASDYLANTTPDLLVVGPKGFDSDKLIFASDGNATITSMASAAGFNSMCSTVLQQLIETVPSGITLTNPIVPYDVKPSALQLTLLGGGAALSFTGQIRIRTTIFPASQIAAVQLVFVDRNGGSQCGGGGCTISTSPVGSSAGFDDTFVFYGFSYQIPTSTSISAFNVMITFVGGATTIYNNNGVGYPVQDTIMLQTPQSCLSPVGGMQNLTIVAAVRNTIVSPTVTLALTKQVPVSGLSAPTLQTTSLVMAPQSTIGPYTLYAASSVLNIYQLASTNIKFDVSVGTVADSFKNSKSLSNTCTNLSPNVTSTTLVSTSSTTTTSAPSTASVPAGWTALGCYTDNVEGGRTLRNGEAVPGGAAAMTVELCVAACQAAGFILAGVEYSQECWCDNTLNYGGGPAPDGNAGCNMPCKGNPLETCGGPNRLNMNIAPSSTSTSSTSATTLSSSTTSATSVPATTSASATTSVSTSTSASATASAPAGWTALGCYSDNVNGGRTLQNGEAVPGGYTAMTVELCVVACQAAGFILAGVEYSQECWCDNSFYNGGGPALDGSVGCNMPCQGNPSETCGGPNRLDVYSLGSSSTSSSPSTSATTLSTITSSSTLATTSSTTTSSSATSSSANSSTATSSLATSSSNPSSTTSPSTTSPSTTSSLATSSATSSYTPTTSTTASPTTTSSSTPSSIATSSTTSSSTITSSITTSSATTSSTSSTTTSSITTSSSTTTSSTTMMATTSTTSTTSASATASAPPGWIALGCYTDNVNGGRTLRNGQDVPGGSSAMTVELCVAACQNGGFLLAGVEYAGECYCDNSYNFGGGPAPDGNMGCNMPCKGDTSETCGGPNRLDVFQNTAYAPVVNPNIAGYTYQGCYNEPQNARALSDSSTASDSMTVEICASFCNGANFFGVEYGRECYCGASVPTTSTLQPASDCSFTCSGNSLEYCGAGNRLNLYEKNNAIDSR